MEMTSIVVEMFSYSGNMVSSNNYFKVFKNPHFGKFGRPAPKRLLKLNGCGPKLFQVLSTRFSWLAS